ncbi:hypothetical protein ATM97_22640 [Nocardia sp. MH4]|uniref:hypothetical protein n=1 Tax=unclassified Nocardia TaxID=2637762 RepID=UPI001C4E61CA|nr:hypothetical protein [Nocardia sp. MH4]MBW0272888.1 hypothetical protein [Nocardia sp. MH4]
MTRSALRHTIAMIGAGGALAGAVVAGSGVANAAEVPAYGNVRYVFCSDAQTGNEITYYDSLGKRDEVVTLTDPMEGDRWCRTVDVRFPKESFTWAAISHSEAHYAYAAIYVDGKLVARDEDRSSFGYVAAQAM